MKSITILVPEGAILGSIETPRQVLTEANKFLLGSGRPALGRVQLAGLSPSIPVAGGRYTVCTDLLIRDIGQTDLILIPALEGAMPQVLEQNQPLIAWLIRQYFGGAEVAAFSEGAFLLAATGLVNGRSCATHWTAAPEFRRTFPEVELLEDKTITDEDGIYTSGSAFPYQSLVLYLIEKYAGRDVSHYLSRTFQLEPGRSSHRPFVVFNSQKAHTDEAVQKAQAFIEQNIGEKIAVSQLAAMLALGRRALERRFKKATSNTVVEYIQRVKMEAAKMSLESRRHNVNEVMYHVGYTDPKSFRVTFKRITGLSPVQYRSQYTRKMAV
jgi:transcriptional regulator GlxA family with amidase domain